MTDDLYECQSSDCTRTTEGASGLAEHINENHPGGFRSDDWLSFSNPDAVHPVLDIGDRQTISDESNDGDDETDENNAEPSSVTRENDLKTMIRSTAEAGLLTP